MEVLDVEVFAELAVAVVLDVADVFDAEAAVAEVFAAIWVDAVCLALVVEEVLVLEDVLHRIDCGADEDVAGEFAPAFLPRLEDVLEDAAHAFSGVGQHYVLELV